MRHAVVLVMLLAGCAEADLDSSGEDLDIHNGVRLNGTSLNGIRLNGTSLGGVRLDGVTLTGTSLAGIAADGSSLDGRTLTGTADREPTAGASAIGSTWFAVLPVASPKAPTAVLPGHARAGATITLRIDSAEPGTGEAGGLWFYGVSYRTADGWQPLCTDDDGQPSLAIAVAGVWASVVHDSAHYVDSKTQFTWACRARSIAKCVEMGYRPWKDYVGELTSCVRLLRGDYCGSGHAYTVDGTLLNLYDDAGIQLDTEDWSPEAAWGPDGAVCVNPANRARYDLVRATDPECARAVFAPTCGEEFLPGAFLIDELP